MLRRIALVAALAFVVATPRSVAALASLRPGDAPPGFLLPDLSGGLVGSANLAGAPWVVLFWSTWSPRSSEMLEDFKRHAAAYAGRGLKIVAVNIDGENLGATQKEAIRAYAAARELPFPVLVDEGLRTFAAWGVMAHPTEVLLDAAGRIAYVLPGYPLSLREELEEEIRKTLGLPPLRPKEQAAPAGLLPQGMAQQQFNLGRRLLALGDSDKALAAFRRAAAADPSFLEAAIMIARVSLADGNAEEAEALARKVNPDAVNRGDLRYLLGCLTLAKGELDAAERVFRALEERLPREGWGAWGLAQAALARGETAAALALFRDALKSQPENLEGEAFVRRYFRDRWLRREHVPDEEKFAELFPGLGEMRERYRKLFDAAGAPAAAP